MLSIFMSKTANRVIQISDNMMQEYRLYPRSYFHSYKEEFDDMTHNQLRKYIIALYPDAAEVDDSFITL